MTIAPIGGLCNRMRAINSACMLAAKIDSKLELLWGRDASLNCRFEELFEVPFGVAKIIDVDLHTRRGRMVRQLEIARRAWFGRQLYRQPFVVDAMDAGKDLACEFAGKSIVVETCSAFYPSGNFDRFVPVVALAEKINEYRHQLYDAVGVHVRRTDNDKSQKYSPTDKFIIKMHEMLEAGMCTRFFLATDAPEVERQFNNCFPGKLITIPKTSFDRDDPAAIKDALVDLYCLAQCQQIIGSYWSSFSEMAAVLNNHELTVIMS